MIRNDFVSNSSSSSFIVISNSGQDLTKEIKKKYKKDTIHKFPISNAKHQFGWEFENTCDFEGKLNFIALQLLYILSHEQRKCSDEFNRLYNMIKKVCKDKFGFSFQLNTDILQCHIFAYDKAADGTSTYLKTCHLDCNYYIDHQSSVDEGSCMEMFNSEDDLYNFLRFDTSYIQGGNDNS